QPCGFFVLWGTDEFEDKGSAELDLRLVAEVLARRLELEQLRLKSEFYSKTTGLCKSLRVGFRQTDRPAEQLAVLSRELRAMIATDYLSLHIIPPGESTCDRYTVGPSDQVLRQRGMAAPSGNQVIDQILVSGEEIVVKDLLSAAAPKVDRMVPNGMRSAMFLPLTIGRKVSGLLTLASEKEKAFGLKETELFKQVQPLVSQVVGSELQRIAGEIWQRRLDRLTRVLAGDRALTGSLDQLCDRLAGFIEGELHPEMVRVATVDPDGSFLSSRALRCRRPLATMAPATGSMILSLMPNHEQVVATGESVMLSQNLPGTLLPEAEASLMYSAETKQMLVVPVVVGNKTQAIITLADSRVESNYALDTGTKTLVQAAGRMLSELLLRQTIPAESGEPKIVSRLGQIDLSTDRHTISGPAKVEQARTLLSDMDQSGQNRTASPSDDLDFEYLDRLVTSGVTDDSKP
ncbi:MAG: GAF domain-containing protein, partial [candidate division Zixibacteria bacterium]